MNDPVASLKSVWCNFWLWPVAHGLAKEVFVNTSKLMHIHCEIVLRKVDTASVLQWECAMGWWKGFKGMKNAREIVLGNLGFSFIECYHCYFCNESILYVWQFLWDSNCHRMGMCTTGLVGCGTQPELETESSYSSLNWIGQLVVICIRTYMEVEGLCFGSLQMQYCYSLAQVCLICRGI